MLTAVAATPGRWEQMDYGSVIASSVTLPWAANGEDLNGIVLKGLTVRLGDRAWACFDTGELRWAAAWSGEGLKLMGTPFDGTHRPPERSRPAAVGTMLFGTSHGPGATADGDWRDLRTEPYIPLSADRAHYRGLDRVGDAVVLHYTVGTTTVHELPGWTTVDGAEAFSRTLTIEPHAQPISLLASELRLELRNQHASVGVPPAAGGQVMPFGPLTAAMDPLPAGARWEILNGSRLVLHLPAASKSVTTRLWVSRATPKQFEPRVTAGDLGPTSHDVEILTLATEEVPVRSNGKSAPHRPARWPEVIETSGKLGTTDGAYAVDSIPLPDENPWKAWMRPGGFDFFADGDRCAVCTWSGDVWIASGLRGDLSRIKWRRFAAGLFQPLGLKIVHDQIHVLGRDQITRLLDLDGDCEADRYECFNNDVSITPNFHEFALDLHADAVGNFYFTKGGPLLGTEYWDPIGAHNGSVLKVSADGRHLERYATGLRAPNGSAVGPDGQVTCSDNEGIWTPVCRLNWVKPGGFYGAMGLDHRAVPPVASDPPLCWLPFAIDNSSGGQVWADSRFGPLSGALIHLSYGKCRAFVVLRETVGGVVQGGVVPLPWRFDSSAMRGRIHPLDGTLWVAGFKGWQTTAVRDGALHRVRPTGKPMPGLTAVHASRGHLRLEFNTPLAAATANATDSFDIQEWNYRWSESYGSNLYSVIEPGRTTGKKGELKGDVLRIEKSTLGRDGRSVDLEVGELKPAMQLMVRATLTTSTGDALPVEYYGTVHRLE